MHSSEKQRSMTSLSDTELDALILTSVNPYWSKVALVIGATMEKCSDGNSERLLSRIKTLVISGRVEKAGDVNKPRHSEIRLPKVGVTGIFDKVL
jgi:hypothetical protein